MTLSSYNKKLQRIKLWKRRNKIKIAEQTRIYRLNNKEKIRKRGQEYRKTDNYKNHRKMRYIKNINKIKQTKRKWYLNNKVIRQHDIQLWSKNNPIRIRLYSKKAESKRRNLKFNLTEEWFLAHFSQGCEITGHDLILEKGSPWSAEIDRIKPGGDYTMDNCRIVCTIFNRARNNWGDEAVFEMVNGIKQ